MNGYSVRLAEVSIEGLKNVKSGTIKLDNDFSFEKANILGLYGQNGSGKTTLIDALDILKYVICGKGIPNVYKDIININKKEAKLKFSFNMINEDKTKTLLSYVFSLRKEEEIDNLAVFNEIFSYSTFDEGRKSTITIADTSVSDEEVLLPKNRLKDLIGKKSPEKFDVILEKINARNESRSFLFSKRFIEIINKNCINEEFKNIILKFALYIHRNFYVVKTSNMGMITLNTLPLEVYFANNDTTIRGPVFFEMGKSFEIATQVYKAFSESIDNMNVVLKQLVPGLSLGVEKIDERLNNKNEKNVLVQLTSNRNGNKIPLSYESDGIQKIISILQLLINVYNNDSITVAIDELDNGVFEYLLGEILKIISEDGEGQLIFTSHNLRPLETIDKKFVVFTTTDENDRYFRIKNVKTNNNLRDFYYRDIVLGGQKKELYDRTDNINISLAFSKAGGFNG